MIIQEIKLKKLEQDDMNAIYNTANQYREYLIHKSQQLRIGGTGNDTLQIDEENNKRDLSILNELVRSLVKKAVSISQPTTRSLKLQYHTALLLADALKFDIDYGNSGQYESSIVSKLYYKITPKL